MKKGFLIISAVAGYSFFEVVLLLTTGLVRYGDPITSFRTVLLFAQFLTIPGMAVVLSLIMHGHHQWKRRVTLYLVTVPGFFIVMLVPALPVALVERSYSNRGGDPGDSILVRSADYWYPVIVLVLVSILGFFLMKKARKQCIAVEASRWLAERQTGIGHSELKWRHRSIRIALCIPASIVLLVFLFLPETWGIISHLRHPRASRVDRYHVPIPVTWIVVYDYSFPGGASVSGFAGSGVGLGAGPYIRGRLPFSHWNIGTTSYQWDRQKYDVVGRREFLVAGTNLSCVEYSPPNKEIPKYETARYGAPLVDIDCSSPDRLYASFYGEQYHVAAFYRMLSGTTKTE